MNNFRSQAEFNRFLATRTALYMDAKAASEQRSQVEADIETLHQVVHSIERRWPDFFASFGATHDGLVAALANYLFSLPGGDR
jgi:hypothetical protein